MPWALCTDADLGKLVEAGVEVPLGEAKFAERAWPTQQNLLGAKSDDLDALVDFAPQADGLRVDYAVKQDPDFRYPSSVTFMRSRSLLTASACRSCVFALPHRG